MRHIHISRAASVAAATLLFFAAGCRDNGPNGPTSTENVTLTVQAAPAPTAKTTIESLRLTSVKVLLKNIKFSQATSDDSTDVYAGPRVVALDLGGSRTEIALVRIRPGLYDRVRFTVHKPEDTEPIVDPDFRIGPSGDQRFSVIITGLYRDVPFTYRSRESSAQVLRLSTPLAIPEDGTVNVTLNVDPYLWFTDGAVVLDPGTQRNQIDDRIKQSFAEAYRDNDRNGQPD